MSKFINPFTDIGFKKIFGQSVTKGLLIDFLNDLLKGEKQIKDITFLDKEQMPIYDGDRGLIYDIYCTTETGEKIIVEMQNKYQDRFKERSLYYLSQAVVRQGERGTKWQYEIKAVYGVFFMNFYLGRRRDAFARMLYWRTRKRTNFYRQDAFHLFRAPFLPEGRGRMRD